MPDRRRFLALLASLPVISHGCNQSAERPGLKVGDVMPAVELPMADGQAYARLPGSGALLLNFWATWCLPCRLEMKSLDRTYAALGARGLRVIGISVDADAFLVREFILGERLKFPVLLDPDGAMAKSRFRVQVYPSTFLIDDAGRIAEIWLGERDWDAPEIRKRLERVL